MNHKLLLIEDDITLRDLYTARFGIDGFTIDVATDGEAGLAKAKELIPDVILLDLRIPKLSGFEVLRQLKQDDTTKAIPVIVLTALSGDEDRDQVMKLGGAAFLTKSETVPKQVLDEINRVLPR
ncbi:MAG: response regulator [Patescibacteria group bacterium]